MAHPSTHPQLHTHYTFLRNLLISCITILIFLLISYVALHVVGICQFMKRKRRWKRDDVVVSIDEHEGGEAKYLLTIVTRSDYKNSTTATTTVHLIGGVFPGRIHDIPRCKAFEKYPIFSPLCHERIVVIEDTSIDPVIGIVIKTNHVGSRPVWNCRHIIVRNLETNDAWHFQMKKEVGYARCVEATDAKHLVSLSHAFTQRLLQECKHGQHIIFGVYFWERTSVYNLYQRITVMVIAHICLMAFVLLSICITIPVGQDIESLNENITRKEKGFSRFMGVHKFGWSLHGESAMSIWFGVIWPSSLLAALITTILGFIMNLHFRERETYEVGFSEMDYVIATALREISMKNRETLAKIKARQEQGKNVNNIAVDSVEDTISMQENLYETVALRHNLPSAVMKKLAPRVAREMQRVLFIGGKYLKDPKYSKYLAPSSDNYPFTDDRKNIKIVKTPNLVQKESKTEERVGDPGAVSTTGASIRKPKYSSFRDINDHDEVVIDGNKTLVTIRSKKRLFSVPELRSPNYSRTRIGASALSRLHEHEDVMPGELDPNYYKARSFFKPVIAWIVAGAVFFLSCFCFALMIPIGPGATVHVDLFVMLVMTTFFVAMINLCFIFETVKISLISLFYAYNDWRLYQLIQHRSIIPKDLGFQYKL